MPGKQYTQISISEDDIRKAFANDSAKCVVATALARTIPGATRIEVDTQTIRYTGDDGKRHVFLTPYAVHGYIIAFDAGDEIEPFTFRLWHEREVTTRRLTRTAAGKSEDRARSQVSVKRKAKEKADAKAADESLSPPERRLAKAEQVVRASDLQKAEADFLTVREMTAGQPKVTTIATEGERPRMKRVRAYKTRTREYGHRVMRINQVSD
jgi:hypothetical protein